MITNERIRSFVILAGTVVALAACQNGPDSREAGEASAPADGVASVTEEKAAAAREVIERGDSPGKLTPPIDIDYRVLGEPKPGEPVEIELAVRTSLEGPVEIRLDPQQGLAMGATQEATIRRQTMVPLVEPATERVVVIPDAEGRFYLSVIVAVATAEGQQLRAIGVPIQVGDKPPTLKPGGELTTTEGETVMSMPAKETRD